MIYEITTITIEVDESLLTKEQQIQVNNADTDLNVHHPVYKGLSRLTQNIRDNALIGHFNYLGTGRKAVKITVR